MEIDELLRIILHETDIPQVRLSSLEPMDVDERLIDAMVAGGERVAPFCIYRSSLVAPLPWSA